MKIAYQALLEFKSIREAIDFARENGFDGVELGLSNPHLYHEFMNESIETDMPILMHSVEGFDLFTPVDEIKECGMEWLLKVINRAKNIGVKVFTIHLGFGIPFAYTGEKLYLQEYFSSRFEKRIDSILSILAQQSIVSVENVGGFRFPFVQKLIQKYIDQGLKLTWDIGHTYLLKGKAGQEEEFFFKNKSAIANVHVHDNKGVTDEHNIIGSGNIDFQKYLSRLDNWDGFLTVEVRPKEAALVSFSKLKELMP